MVGAIALGWGTAAGVCVGVMFVVAALSKYRNRALLPAVVANYRLLPAAAARPAAAALPLVEGAIGLFLLAHFWAAPAAAAAIALLLVFALAMEVNIRRGRAFIDCGCGLSMLRQSLRRALVVRNLVLAAMLLPLALMPGSPEPSLHAAAAVAGIGFFLLLLLLNALLQLPPARRLAA